MELKQRVVTLLKEMIAIDSETNTEKEVDMENICNTFSLL